MGVQATMYADFQGCKHEEGLRFAACILEPTSELKWFVGIALALWYLPCVILFTVRVVALMILEHRRRGYGREAGAPYELP